MKRYVNKILVFVMLVLILTVFQSLDIRFIDDIKKMSSNLFTNQLYNPNVLSLLSEGEGENPPDESVEEKPESPADEVEELPTEEKVYDKPIKLYVKQSYAVYNDTTDFWNEEVFRLQKCSEIYVYEVIKVKSGWGWGGGTRNTWYKVSDVADYYVRYSESYLSPTIPDSCYNSEDQPELVTTTRPKPEFNVSVSTTPEEGYDRMYSNKLGSIVASATNIRYLKSNELLDFTIKVTKNSEDVSDLFNISSALPKSNGNVDFEIYMKEDTEYSKGTYNVTISYGSITKSAKFELVDKYYYLDIAFVGNNSQSYSTPYSWNVNIIESENIVKDDIVINVYRVGSSWGSEKLTPTDNFEIESTEKGFVVTTLPNLKSSAIGNYRIVVSYEDLNGNDSLEEPYEFSYNIELIRPTFSADRDTLKMYRYRYFSTETNYSIAINGVKTYKYSDRKYIQYSNDAGRDEITFDAFRNNYSSISFSDNSFEENLSSTSSYNFQYDSNGRIVYRYGNLMVFSILEGKTVSFYSIDGTTITTYNNYSYEEFEKNYSGAIDIMKNDPAYSINSDGSFSYLSSGTTTLQDRVINREKEAPVLATTGGEINIFTNLEKVTSYSLSDATITITNSRGEDVTNIPAFRKHSFKIVEEETLGEGRRKTKYATKTRITILYEEQSQEYAGTYNVTVNFDGMSYSDTFDITEGTIDYYSRAQKNLTDGIEKPIPSNSKVEWFVGIFLSDGTTNTIKRNEKNFEISIYDKRADRDSDGNIYFYDLHNYQVNITNKIGTKITYIPIIDGKQETEVTEDYTSFSKKFSDAAKQIDSGMIRFDSSGNPSSITSSFFISGSNTIEVHRVYYDEENSVQKIDYSVNGNRSEVTLDEAISSYDRLALFINNYLATDSSGNVIGNAIRGTYREKVDNREDIKNQFNIEYNNFDGVDNELKAVSITPNTEVEPGEYYVYLGYNGQHGVGDINNDEENAIFGWNEYPQFWEQNIHMVIIEYDEPDYSFVILPPVLSNVVNTDKEIFNNVKGTATFDLGFENTYNFDNTISSKMYRCTESDCENNKETWIDVTDKFEFNYDLSELQDEEISQEQKFGHLTVTTKESENENGTYIVEVTYKNKGVSSIRTMSFEISESCKGAILNLIDGKDTIYNFFGDTLSVNIETQFLGTTANLVPMIETENGSIYMGDLSSKTIVDSEGNVLFNFDFTTTIGENDYIINYRYDIKNIAKAISAGKYEIYFTYTIDDETISTNRLSFNVLSPVPTINMSLPDDDIVEFDENYIYIAKDITASYISDADLDSILYSVRHFETVDYVDISSSTSANKYATVSVRWDDSTRTDTSISGIMYITLDIKKADLKAESEDYIVQAEYTGMSDSLMYLPPLANMFTWEARKDDLNITGTYYGQEFTSKTSFYEDMEDVKIEMQIKTPYRNNISWAISNSQACYNEYRGYGKSCDVSVNLNRYFSATNTTGQDGKLSLAYNSKDNKLSTGAYFLVLYYDDEPNNRVLVPIIIEQKYMDIDFDYYLIYSESGNTTMDGLFQNKDGFIYLPVIISGISPSDTTVQFTDINGVPLSNRPFTFDQGTYENKSLLDIKYQPNYQIAEAKDYMIIVTANDNTSVSKSIRFTMNPTFFTYSVGEANYSPSEGLIPNSPTGGEAFFRIMTEGLNGLNDISNALPKNTTITDSKGNNVTSKFSVTSRAISGSTNAFYLSVKFTSDSNIEPGVYNVSMNYTFGGYYLEKTASFVVGNYNKNLIIDENVQIFSSTNDNRVHKNVSGTYRISYSSSYDLSEGYMYVRINDALGNDVTDKFNYQITSSYIDVTYKASPELDSGDYSINIFYDENGKVVSSKINVKLYPNFNAIVLSNMLSHPLQGNDIIYSDLDGQYYSFNVNTSGIKLTNYTLVPEVLDSKGNVVTDKFNIVKVGENYNINIKAFNAMIGNYSIRLYVADELGDPNYSNALSFTIDDNFYHATILDTSSINQMKNYNSDTTSIYDKDGAHIIYNYTTDYTGDYKMSVVIFKDGVKIKEFTEYSDNTFDFNTESLDVGTYQVSLCINGIPYDSRDIQVIEYIEIEDIILTVNGVQVDNNFDANIGSNNISIRIVPANATASVITVRSSDTNVLNANNNRMVVYKEGTADLIISTSAKEKSYRVTATQRLASNTYVIDHNAKTIFVNTRTAKNFTVSEFTRNTSGLVSNYRITNSNGANSSSNLIGTGYHLINGDTTYTFIVIGDVTGDGNINVMDVAWLYQRIRNKRSFNSYQTKAGQIRKASSINAVDVAWLYSFVKNKRNSI